MSPARLAAGVLLLAAVACREPVDPEPLGDYTTWKRIDVTGPAPGHGDTYRIIYVNDIAADPTSTIPTIYAVGSVIVKEIRDNDAGTPGALRYNAIMRRLVDDGAVLADEGGWLFSESDDPGGAESHRDFCWDRCHVAAPYNGAWYDYRD